MVVREPRAVVMVKCCQKSPAYTSRTARRPGDPPGARMGVHDAHSASGDLTGRHAAPF
jgi:hypothetical protein